MPTASDRRHADAAAHKRRWRLVEQHAGQDLAAAVKVHWKKATFTTWAEALAELAAGITVTVSCPGQSAGSRWIDHRIRFEADGSITLLAHDQIEDPTTEAMLVALGAPVSQTCRAVGIYLPLHQPVPTKVPLRQVVHNRLRCLHTAVAWAQQPDHDWSPGFGQTHLRYGITPAVLEEWQQAGWTVKDAGRFLRAFAPRAIAEEWRAAGQVSGRVASLAARGERPENEDRWAAAGFPASRSARWRNSGLVPDEAFVWERAGVTPKQVTKIEAAIRRGEIGREAAQQWCAAGMDPDGVVGWYLITGADLPTALRWSQTGMAAQHFPDFGSWNRAHGTCQITPVAVAGYREAGFPISTPDLIAHALGSGVDPGEWADLMAALAVTGSAVQEAMRAHEVAPGEPPKSSFWQHYATEAPVGPYWIRFLAYGMAPDVVAFMVDWLAEQH